MTRFNASLRFIHCLKEAVLVSIALLVDAEEALPISGWVLIFSLEAELREVVGSIVRAMRDLWKRKERVAAWIQLSLLVELWIRFERRQVRRNSSHGAPRSCSGDWRVAVWILKSGAPRDSTLSMSFSELHPETSSEVRHRHVFVPREAEKCQYIFLGSPVCFSSHTNTSSSQCLPASPL